MDENINEFSNSILNKIKNWWKIAKVELLQDGIRLYTDYNYLLVLFAFIILILTVNIYSYLYEHSYYVTELYLTEYKTTLNSILFFMKSLFWILIVIYIFSVVSFYIFIKRISTTPKQINIDPIIINVLYFSTIAYELKSLGSDWTFILLALIPPIIHFVTIKKCELEIKINKWSNILKKAFIFFITSYIVVHSLFFIETYMIIQNDINDKTQKYFKNTSDIFISSTQKYSLDKKNEIKDEIKNSLENYEKDIFYSTKSQWIAIERKLTTIEKKYNIQINKKQVYITFLENMLEKM